MKDEPAYPIIERASDYGESINFGLTKRELIAAMAMQGLLSNPSLTQGTNDLASELGMHRTELRAKISLEHADALLAELAKEGEQ